MLSPRRLLILLLAIVSPSVMAKNLPPVNFSGCELTQTLFFAYSKDRQSAVEVCSVEKGYRFTHGSYTVKENKLWLNKKQGLQVTLPPGEIGSIHKDVRAGFAMKYKDVFIWLEPDTDGEVHLVTADSGWDGWLTAENRKAVLLDTIGYGYINEIDQAEMVPFKYDYTISMLF